jgi:hypothetical protein
MRTKSELSPPPSLTGWHKINGRADRLSAPASVFAPGSRLEFFVEHIARSWQYKPLDFGYHPNFRLLHSYGNFDVIASRPGYIGSNGILYYLPTRYLLVKWDRASTPTKDGARGFVEVIREGVPGSAYRDVCREFQVEANALSRREQEEKKARPVDIK